jgi:hypothetical protein
MSEEIGFLWDCRAKAGQYCELILTDTRQTATLLKGFRNAECQALSHVRIPCVPQNEDELRNDEHATMLAIAVRSGDHLRYERVIILRRDDSEDISGIISTVKRFCPELLEQRRLFVTEFRAPIDVTAFHRALGAAAPVSVE